MRHRINRTWVGAASTVVGMAFMACGGSQQVVEEVETVQEIEELDIPGVNPRALQAYYDGVRAMNETPTNYTAALSAFQRAYDADPDFWEALENIGLIQMDLGMYQEAAATFRMERRVIDDLVERGWPVLPRPEILLNLGKALALAGSAQEAATAFGELLAEDPSHVEALANLAALSVQMRNYDAARDYIGELLEMSLNDVGALGVLALIAKEQDDRQMAVYLWQKTLAEIDVTREALADEEQYAGLTDEEADRLRIYNESRAERLTKVLSDIQNELGIVQWTDGDHDSAELLFRLAVQNNSTNAAAHINLGAVYLDYANFDGACYHFEEALALRPRDEIGLVGFASCTYGLGDVDGAYDAFQRAFAEHGRNAFVAQRLGEIAFQDLNDPDAATNWFTRTLELRGINPASCDPSTNRECATLRSIEQMQQMNAPRTP